MPYGAEPGPRTAQRPATNARYSRQRLRTGRRSRRTPQSTAVRPHLRCGCNATHGSVREGLVAAEPEL